MIDWLNWRSLLMAVKNSEVIWEEMSWDVGFRNLAWKMQHGCAWQPSSPSMPPPYYTQAPEVRPKENAAPSFASSLFCCDVALKSAEDIWIFQFESFSVHMMFRSKKKRKYWHQHWSESYVWHQNWSELQFLHWCQNWSELNVFDVAVKTDQNHVVLH